MDDDWASDGEEEVGLGDISAIPVVNIPEPVNPPKPVIQNPVPQPNAWASPIRKHHNDARVAPGPRPVTAPPSRQMNRRNVLPPRDQRSTSREARGVTLYLSNLPFDTNESQIDSFFAHHGVNIVETRLTHHSDTGNIKAALVTIHADQNRAHALSLDGKMFGSRTLHLKIDGTDGNRRNSGRDRGDRDRNSFHGGGSYGGGFGGRERRSEEPNTGNGTWGPGTRHDHSHAPGFDRAVDRRGLASDPPRDDRRSREPHGTDPTIPTGPTPAGRKKLNLKARTKPLPVLDVDPRAIDIPRATASTPSGMDKAAGEKSSYKNVFKPSHVRRTQSSHGEKGDGGRRAEKFANDDSSSGKWTSAKDSGQGRSAGNSSQSKKEDGASRPVFVNTFAALEVNDSDA